MTDDDGKAPKTMEEFEQELVFGSKENAEAWRKTHSEPEAAAPNYDADMAEDARGLAQGLAEMFGVSMENIHTRACVPGRLSETEEMSEGDIPEPTLESLHARLSDVDASFVTNLTALRKDRLKGRESAAQAGMIEYLHSGKIDKMRAFATGQELWPRCVARLDDASLTTLVSSRLQDHGLTAVALGIYVGALLTRNGLSMGEAIACANDPVFGLQTLALKVTPSTVTDQALEVISDVHQQKAVRGQPSS